MPMPCELVSWSRFDGLCRELAARVRASGYRPEMLVAIERGGYMPARVLSDLLGIEDVAGFRVCHYRGASRQREARIEYPLSAAVTGKRVLLVDDITDSGETFEQALLHLEAQGPPRAVRSAALVHKAVSRQIPDFYARRMRKWHWVVFPWALVEDVGSFLRAMAPPPASLEEAAARLQAAHGIRLPRTTLAQIFTALAWIDGGAGAAQVPSRQALR